MSCLSNRDSDSGMSHTVLEWGVCDTWFRVRDGRQQNILNKLGNFSI